ncbi:hypothetical protein CPB83DRAFT_855262 [Crepidotus variabilis]|uniref:Uncharacterized protein n=1 Tax=Crepidotus variabilis TaxID=179855 RepID=A0A9P6JPQ7_9AGAR|nr:hypothetical protein CPB83DRAFT_855262 [Crepidotus variabilis]
MPVPVVVYVAVAFGTVGAVFAFKEFVYEPHIAPAVGRWREERRMRRSAMMHAVDVGSEESDEDDGVPLVERRARRPSASSSRTTSSRGSSDEGGSSTAWGLGTGQKVFRNEGLNLRRPRQADVDSFIELETLSRPVNARKTVNVIDRFSMDESIDSLPYRPLSPQTTHILFDSASVSPSTTANPSRLPSIPATPTIQASRLEFLGGEETTKRVENQLHEETPRRSQTASHPLTPSSSSQTASLNPPNGSPLLTRSMSEGLNGSLHIEPIKVESSVQREGSPKSSPLATSYFNVAPLSAVHHLERTLSPPLVPVQRSDILSPPLQHVPSLSQSYPQDLDYEHGLELLSPPSSRSDSPFDMADLSPKPLPAIRAISPRNNDISTQPTSPLALNVESFSPITPAAMVERLYGSPAAATPLAENMQSTIISTPTFVSAATSLAASPRHDPLSAENNRDGPSTPQSVSSSAYLSLGETTSGDEGGDEDDDDIPLARGQSLRRPLGQLDDHGLGLTFVPPSPQAASTTLSPRADLLRAQPSRRLPATSTGHSDIDSMSELSDLDLMSDYAPSDGELIDMRSENGGSSNGGRRSRAEAFLNVSPVPSHGYAYESESELESVAESDASWSVAGGSDVGESERVESPQLTRGGTLRGRGGRGPSGQM